MRRPRRLAMIVALALAITAIGAATGWLVLRRDPSVQVGSVPISGISVRRAADVGHPQPSGRGA